MDIIRRKIILVDDDMATVAMGRNILKIFYEVYPAPSAAKLFEVLDNVFPDLILLDIEMPQMDGFETIQRLKADKRFADIPVIFLSARNDENSELEGLNFGAADYVSKPFSAPLLLKRIANQLLIAAQTKELLAHQAALQDHANNLEARVREKTAEVINLQNTVLATVSDLVEFRDKLTGGHIARTQRYMKALIEEMIRQNVYMKEITQWDMEFLLPSAQLHDVGKIGITDQILNKPDKLTQNEFEIMKTHVSVGVDAIERMMNNTTEHAFLRHTLYIAGTHHEKWDGTGYPTGLKGENIPLEGRLMAIADVYDALISTRSYKEALTHEAACQIINLGFGTHFDPALTRVFRAASDEFCKIALEVGI